MNKATMRPKLQLLLFKCLAVLFGLTIFCVLAEVVLRFAPVCESVYSLLFARFIAEDKNPALRAF